MRRPPRRLCGLTPTEAVSSYVTPSRVDFVVTVHDGLDECKQQRQQQQQRCWRQCLNRRHFDVDNTKCTPAVAVTQM